MTNPLVVNPTESDAERFILKVAEKVPYLDHFNSVTIELNSQKQDVAFTLPVFVFTKPVRESKKFPGTMKPKGRYCAVYEPKALGVGSFAGVYPIKGTWKIENGTATFKTKKPGTPERLVKSDPEWETYPTGARSSNAFKSFVDEQKIGYWAEYMGYKYAPILAGNRSFLLMNRQPGVSLKSIIDKLQKNPDFLSITQKLQITVALLKEAQLKLHHDKIPSIFGNSLAHIVHRDLKPENIIVDLGPPVAIRYIDFGLAKRSDERCSTIVGTPLYFEPQLFEYHPYNMSRVKPNADKISDMFSIARIIAELWGDISRDSVNTTNQLRDQNKLIPLTGLLSGITGLTDTEETLLRISIQKMNQHDPQARLSQDQALNIFEKLLADRLKIEEQIMAINIKRSVEDLSDKELLNILRSDQFKPLLLQKLQNKPDTVNYLVSTLHWDLATLSEGTLEQLKTVGMDLSNSTLIETGIASGRLSPDQVSLLARLGAPVSGHLLENHLKLTINDTNWIAMCRTLYHLTDNSEAILQKATHTSEFHRLYCNQFLKLNAPELDSYHNLLIQRHLTLVRKRNYIIAESRRIVTTLFKDSPELNLLLSSELLDTTSDKLYLVESTDLKNLNSDLTQLEKISSNLKKINSDQNMPHRQAAVELLKSQLAEISINNRNEWERRISILEIDIKQFLEFERLAEQIRNYARDIGWALSETEFDAFFAEINSASVQKLREQRDLISAAAGNLRAIRQYQKALSNWGLPSSINTMFEDALANCQLGNIDKLASIATLYMNLYAEMIQNSKDIKSSPFETVFMPPNRQDFYKRLDDYFLDRANQSDINSLRDDMKSISAFLSMNSEIKQLVLGKSYTMSKMSITLLFQYFYQNSEGDIRTFIDRFVANGTHFVQNNLIDSDFCQRFNELNNLNQGVTTPLSDHCKKEFFDAVSHYLTDPIKGTVDEHKTIWRQKLDVILFGINPGTPTTRLSNVQQTLFYPAPNPGATSGYYGQKNGVYW